MTVTVQENCFFCDKSLIDQEWVWVCRNCGISWCNEHKKTHFKWNAWSGLGKADCPNCGTSLKSENIEVLPNFSDWPERFGVAKPIEEQPTAEPADVVQEPEIVESKPPTPTSDAAAPAPEEKPVKKSIVGAVIMLLIFGALAIFGIVSLFTLWDEGFYWILASIGFISFGGRIAIASIQDIREYYQQKSER